MVKRIEHERHSYDSQLPEEEEVPESALRRNSLPTLTMRLLLALGLVLICGGAEVGLVAAAERLATTWEYQQVSTPLRQAGGQPTPRFRVFSPADGPAGTSITALYEAHNGAIWVAGTKQQGNGPLNTPTSSPVEEGAGVSRFDSHGWTTYTRQDGLAANHVSSIVQATDGAMWFGTSAGASRFDGQNWRTFTHKDGLLTDASGVLLATANSMWIAPPRLSSVHGLSRFDGTRWETYASKEGLPDAAITALLEDKTGALFAATAAGVSRFNGGNWQTTTSKEGLEGDSVEALLLASDGSVWAAGQGLNHFANGKWSGVALKETPRASTGKPGSKAPSSPPATAQLATSLVQGSDGAIWIGTNVGLWRYDGRTMRHFGPHEGLPADQVSLMVRSADDSIWLATPAGLTRYAGQFSSYTARDGLPGGILTGLLAANDGSLWLGSDAGLGHASISPWLFYGPQDGVLPGSVAGRFFVAKDGSLWLATEKGLSQFNGKTWQMLTNTETTLGRFPDVVQARDQSIYIAGHKGLIHFDGRSEQTLSPPAVQLHAGRLDLLGVDTGPLLATAEGPIWTGIRPVDRTGALSSYGISRFDGKSWQTFSTAQGLGGPEVRSLLENHDGTIWAAPFDRVKGQTVGKGISHFDGQTWKTYTTTDGLAGMAVTALAATPAGRLLVGTETGLSSFDGQTWKSYTTRDGLAGNSILALLPVGENDWWVGTDKGASHFDGQSWKHYSLTDGLAGNEVTSLLQTGDQAVWAASGTGISRFDGRVWSPLTARDGIAGNHVTALVQALDGSLWFASAKGVTRFTLSPSTPRILVTGIHTAAGLHVAWPARSVHLPNASQTIRLDLAGIAAPTSPDGLSFLYRLEGVEGNWQSATPAPGTGTAEVTYPSLPSGSYRFEAIARDQDGRSTPSPLILTLVIDGPVKPGPDPLRVLAEIIVSLFAVMILFAFGSLGVFVLRTWQTPVNPYSKGGPVQGGEIWAGRARLLHKLLQLVPTNPVLIYGEAGLGKTALLYELARRLTQPPPLLPSLAKNKGKNAPEHRTYLSAEDLVILADPADTEQWAYVPLYLILPTCPESEFFSAVMQRIGAILERYLLPFPALRVDPKNGHGQGYDEIAFAADLQDLLLAVRAQVAPRQVKLVFLLDGADCLITLSDSLQVKLRRILFGPLAENLSLVIAGGPGLGRAWLEHSQALLSLCVPIELQPLTQEETHALVEEPVRDRHHYTPEAAQLVYELSSGRPWLVQRLCHTIMASRPRRLVTAEDVEQAHAKLESDHSRDITSGREIEAGSR